MVSEKKVLLILSYTILAMFFVCSPQAAHAAIKTWSGGDANWNVAGNWTPTGVPAGADNIIIDGGPDTNSIVHLDVNFELSGTLTIESGDHLIIDVLVAGDVTLTNLPGGTINNDGTIINIKGTISNDGTINNNSEGSISNNVQGTITNKPGGLINNEGIIDIQPGTLLSNSKDGTINNLAGGQIGDAGAIINDSEGLITNGGSITITPTGTINNSGTITNNIGGTIQNDGTINTCGGIINNVGTITGNAPVDLGCADLALTMTASEDLIVPGEKFFYTLAVNNLGPSSAAHVTVTDTLPGVFPFDSASSSAGCSETIPGSGTIICDLGDIAVNGQPTEVTIWVTNAVTGGLWTNEATVSSGNMDQDTNNNTASAKTEVPSKPVRPTFPRQPEVLGTIVVTLAIIMGGMGFLIYRKWIRAKSPPPPP